MERGDLISRSKPILWALAIPLLAGAGLLFYATSQFGLGVSHDSVIYLDTAQTLSTRGTLARPSPDGRLVPLTAYPPLYPSVLAALGSSMREIHQQVRPLNIALFLGTGLLLGLLTYRCTNGSVAATLISVGLATLSLDLLIVHSRVWSEPPFLFLMTCGLLLFGHYTKDPDWRWLCLAAVSFALAWLTRYIGVVFIPTGVIAIWCLVERDRRTRILHSVLYTAVASGPIAVALLQNRVRAGNSTNRRLSMPAISADTWYDGFATLSGWLVPASSPLIVKTAAVAFLAGVVVHAAVTAWRCVKRTDVGHLDPQFTSVVWLFLVSYAIGVLFARASVDSAITWSPRILSPVLLALLVLVPSYSIETIRGSRARYAAGLVVIALLSFYGLRAMHWAATARGAGLHYNTERWHQSPALSLAKGVPACVKLYSNRPELVQWITGRRASILEGPHSLDVTDDQEQPQNAVDNRLPPMMLVLIHEFEREPFAKRFPDVMSRMIAVWRDQQASAYTPVMARTCAD